MPLAGASVGPQVPWGQQLSGASVSEARTSRAKFSSSWVTRSLLILEAYIMFGRSLHQQQ